MWPPLIAALVTLLPPWPPGRYEPSAYHATRPVGAIYNDEIGEDIVGETPYRRVVEVFGPPLVRRPPCVFYRQVGDPGRHWRFCFDEQRRMESAMANVRVPGVP